MRKILLLVFFTTALTNVGQAQFFNGSQTDFSKIRTQYYAFDWRVQRYQNFDVFFYRGEENMAEEVAKMVHEEQINLCQTLKLTFDRPLQFFLYKSRTEFIQHNLGTSSLPLKNANEIQVLENKLLLYYEGSQEQLRQQIRKVIAKRLIQHMLSGGQWATMLVGNDFNKHPTWFIDGLASYLAMPWSAEIEGRIKDGFLTGRYDNLAFLNTEESIYAGHAVWFYIAETYGAEQLINIIYASREYEHVNRGLTNILGMNIQYLMPLIGNYFKERFIADLEHQFDFTESPLPIDLRPDETIVSFDCSKNEEFIAYAVVKRGKVSVRQFDLKTEKTKTWLRYGERMDQVADNSQPVVCIHPSGEYISVFAEIKGQLQFIQIDLIAREQTQKAIPRLEKVLSASYDQAGTALVMSAVHNGQTDLYHYRISANNPEQLTNDLADDHSPIFVNNDTQIAFGSNRLRDTIDRFSDTLQPSTKTTYFYLYPFEDRKKSKQILQKLYNNTQAGGTQIKPSSALSYWYLSSEKGLNNLNKIEVDSTIVSVDTSIHYRYIFDYLSFSNVSTNIKGYHELNNGQMLLHIHQNGRDKIVQVTAPQSASQEKTRIKQSMDKKLERQIRLSQLDERDETAKEKPKSWVNADSSYVINRLVLYSTDTLEEVPKNYRSPLRERYKVNFARNRIRFRVDNSFLSEAYQQFNPENIQYQNPNISGLLSVDLTDVLDNFIIQGAIRIPTSKYASETLLNLSFLENRTDHRISYYRRTFERNRAIGLSKEVLHNVSYTVAYPLSRAQSVHFKVNNRLEIDRPFFVSEQDFERTTDFNFFPGIVASYILNNAQHFSVNSWSGTKFKAFVEYQQNPTLAGSSMFNLGFDARHSHSILKELIWVNRLAASTSLGNQRLLYYMGAVDNWILRPVIESNPNINIDPSQNFAYQTIATPMRGFIQNTRNGNSFFIYNSELRVPVFQLLKKQVVTNEPLRSFQLIGFFDMGTAWSGPTWLSEENHFNTQTIENKPVTLLLKNSREPIIAATGVGLRSKIFGYFVRVDVGWGIENFAMAKRPRIFLSLAYDI